MKILSISDVFIDQESILEGLRPILEHSVRIENIEWKVKDMEELQNINLYVEKNGSDSYSVPIEIIDACKDADIIITHFCPINRELIRNARNLKIIGVLRSGYENINVDFASQSGVLVINTPGRNADSVADFTVGMIIAECRNIARGHYGLKQGKWEKDFPNSGNIPELSGKIVGLLGFGAIGEKVALRLRGFNMNICVHDPYISEFPDWVKVCTLNELLEKSDFISLHLKYCEATKNLINKNTLNKMKKTTYLINTARAGIINENDLYEALKNKKIAGAALDVYEKEPPGIDYPLISLDNVTITPHMAGGTNDAFKKSPKMIAENLLNLWDGEKKLKNIINKDIYLNNPHKYFLTN